MCGIFASAEPLLVADMLDQMTYRGPDAQKQLRSNGLAIGFARLAIVNTQHPAAEQPAVTDKGRLLCFNGELYNYKKLDEHADSEVQLLGQMLDAGVDPRQMLDGDYAILYWNPSQRQVTMYRDRFGVCQLYYQLKPFFAVSSERRRLANPIEVPAFGRVRIDLNKNTVRVDTLQHYGVTCSENLSDNAFVSAFLEAVHSRVTHSDVGFSQIVSGGLDSTAIAFACRELGLMPTLSLLAVPEENQDDARYAAIACKELGVPFRFINVTRGMRMIARSEIIEHLDGAHMSPLRWRMAIRTWYTAMFCESRVLLSGEGSDEVMEGYPPHVTANEPDWKKARHQMTALRSLAHLNLDISHKLGLAHGVEIRAPFLSSSFSYLGLSLRREYGKQRIRRMLKRFGCPPELLHRNKWSDSDRGFSDSYGEQ